MDTPRSRFGRWVAFVGSQGKAAKALGCSQAHVSQVLSSDKTPGLELAHKIRDRMPLPREDGELFAEPPIETSEWLDGYESPAPPQPDELSEPDAASSTDAA
jgi:transcriptional regulator with XRE-family HTH domain